MKIKKTICTLVIAASLFLIYNTLDTVKAETSELPNVPQNTENTTNSEISPFENTNTSSTIIKEIQLKPEDIEPAILTDIKPDVKEIIQETTTVKEQLNENGQTIEIKEKEINTLKIDETGLNNTIKTETTTQEIKKELPVLEEIKLPEVTKKPINNEPVKIEVSSQRIPIGTVIPLKLESQINSVSSNMGDQFNATLTSDIMIGDKIILPAGSVVRGTIGQMKKAGYFIKEAKVMLIFDHIVTPAGKQVPLYAYLPHDENVNYEGYITGGTSYSKTFKQEAAKGKSIMVNATTYGVDKGLKYLGGAPVVLTAPFCAIGGALGGGGYIVGKSVYNMFQKGGNVLLEAGTPLNVTLSKALDIPVN